MINERYIADAIAVCLDRNVPFISFSLPGTNNIEFFSSPEDVALPPSLVKVTLASWLNEKVETIYNKLDARQTLDYASYLSEKKKIDDGSSEVSERWKVPTIRDNYLESIRQLISGFEDSNRKCVISTVRTINFPTQIHGDFFAQKWLKLVRLQPEDFVFIFYTPFTGAWMGASPEKLFSVNRRTRTFSTMALAGTRETHACGPWSEKDQREHRIVVDYIMEKLQSVGLNPNSQEKTNRRYGNITHLMTPICGEFPSTQNFMEIVKVLSPTPALAGYPLDIATSEIRLFEEHPRRMYGGYIAIESEDFADAYVNLRSMEFDSAGCTIYSGGGIVDDSVAENEWKETEMKASTLLNLLTS